jgi:hypothetical protein
MLHRLLALLGYLAARVDALTSPLLRALRLRISGVWLLVALLLVGAAVPSFMEAARRSPQGVTIDQITNRGLSALTSWVRLEGEVVTLRDDRATSAGYAVTSVLIADGKAIALHSSAPVERRSSITGQAANSPGIGQQIRELAPPGLLDGIEVSPNGLVLVDDVPPPESATPWWLVYLGLVVAAGLVVGRLVGYPVFGATSQRPAGALRAGESVPVGVEGELRRTGRASAVPFGAARVSAGDQRGELRLQIAPTEHVPEHELRLRRDMWTSFTPGRLYTIGEAMPALRVRSFALHGTISFGSVSDRDRSAALLDEG